MGEEHRDLSKAGGCLQILYPVKVNINHAHYLQDRVTHRCGSRTNQISVLMLRNNKLLLRLMTCEDVCYSISVSLKSPCLQKMSAFFCTAPGCGGDVCGGCEQYIE